ncbi:RNA polymerase subunit sigma [Rhodopirellula sp. SM50]|nr:sigma-70 family RNA polymerase sigma factor [Rhodopirellula sp. SM50]PAY17517.1 RNA polymerase subunit sigma [Rhodopirellula sp. SM50]
MNDVTQLIHQVQDGDRAASEELLPLVYDELRKLAAAKMASERLDHTLPPTALVHEAYLRLIGSGDDSPNGNGQWDGRGHFFAAAAEAMRRILVDHARNRARLKRGGDAQRQSLDSVDVFWNPKYGDILDLNEALDQLEQVDPQAAELVKLRCFAGQTRDEAAALMGISPSTAKRCWAFARAWLHRHLGEETGED